MRLLIKVRYIAVFMYLMKCAFIMCHYFTCLLIFIVVVRIVIVILANQDRQFKPNILIHTRCRPET